MWRAESDELSFSLSSPLTHLCGGLTVLSFSHRSPLTHLCGGLTVMCFPEHVHRPTPRPVVRGVALVDVDIRQLYVDSSDSSESKKWLKLYISYLNNSLWLGNSFTRSHLPGIPICICEKHIARHYTVETQR